jgi:type 1 glutamine amidotransferase
MINPDKRFLACVALMSVALHSQAAEPTKAPEATPAPKLKVLYITGGGFHNYKILTPIITDGIAKHASVQFDVKWDLEPMRDQHLGEGYDAIVYNICFAKENDPDLIDNALRVTRAGKPTVMIHCSMHTFQASDDWTECCGMRTRVHDKYEPFTIEKATPDHPVTKQFPQEWKTAGDELYQTIRFPDSSTALLTAKSPQPNQNGKESVVCWVHTYGQGRVFGTTLGHDTKTVEQDEYLSLLASGLLWACDKLNPDGTPKPGYRAGQ